MEKTPCTFFDVIATAKLSKRCLDSRTTRKLSFGAIRSEISLLFRKCGRLESEVAHPSDDLVAALGVGGNTQGHTTSYYREIFSIGLNSKKALIVDLL